jgi:Uncharacterized conserved protein
MINLNEVIQTNRMFEKENLDVRTVTLGISLIECIDSDLEKLKANIHDRITNKARTLVSTCQDIEKEFGSPSSTNVSA